MSMPAYHSTLKFSLSNALECRQITAKVTHMDDIGRRHSWLNAHQNDQAMDMQQFGQPLPARSGESLHTGDAGRVPKPQTQLFGQEASPSTPCASRPYPNQITGASLPSLIESHYDGHVLNLSPK